MEKENIFEEGESHIPETGSAYIEEVFYIFLAGMAVFVLLGLWISGGVFLDIYQKRKLKSQTFIAKKYVHKGPTILSLAPSL